MVSFQAVLEEFNRAFLGFQQAEDNLDEGGFATSVRADDAEIIVIVDRQIDILERCFLWVCSGDVMELYDGLTHFMVRAMFIICRFQ